MDMCAKLRTYIYNTNGDFMIMLLYGVRTVFTINPLYNIINTLRPGQHDHHLADIVLKCIFKDGNVHNLIQTLLKCVSKVPILDMTALFQLMVWCLTGAKHKGVWRHMTRLVRNWPLARFVKLLVAHAPGMPWTFPPPPRVSDPDMHHGTCVTHVPWCMPLKFGMDN